jgi:hypothetical protein
MAHTPAWRAFKRTEDCACAFASLIYLGAVLHAWRVLPGDSSAKLLWILAAPSIFLGLCFVLPLLIGPLRRMMVRYVWMSFKSGFGQSPVSILSGLGMLALAAGFIYLQVSGVHRGGDYPAGVFAGYAAGIGVLFAQAILVRVLERHPEVKPEIEQQG